MATKVKAPGVHRGRVVPPAPLTTQQHHDLAEFDELLTQLIRSNRRLHARLDRIAKAFTGIGEDQVDTLLKSVQKRIRTRSKATPRRRVRAA